MRRPPELITEGILTKSADVYAFGVITWEIYVGRCAALPGRSSGMLRESAAASAASGMVRARLADPTALPALVHTSCLVLSGATCRRAWEGLKPTEVLRRVASNVRLQFPAQTPHRLKVCQGP